MEIEKEMTVYEIRTFADILRALREHPDWLEELRRVILTTELLEIPRKIDELLERVARLEKDFTVLKQDVKTLKQDFTVLKQDVETLKQDVTVLKQDVETLKQDVAILKQDVETLKRDVNYLKGEFGRFKGREFERAIRERYYAFFGRLLKRSRLLSGESFVDLIDSAEEEGTISEHERMELLQLDLLVRGKMRQSGKAVALAVEVSYRIHWDDIERAKRRAEILQRLMEEEVIGVVVGAEVESEIEDKATTYGVLVITVAY